MNDVFSDIRQGYAVGADVSADDLMNFFATSFNHCMHELSSNVVSASSKVDSSLLVMRAHRDELRNITNRFKREKRTWQEENKRLPQDKFKEGTNLFNDSINHYEEQYNELNAQIKEKEEKARMDKNQLQAKYRNVLTSHYDGLYELSNAQKNVLGGDSTLSEVRRDSILQSYDNLIDSCQNWLVNVAGINLSERTLMELEMKYGDSLAVNKNNGAWLEMVWNKCNNTTDFDPSDPFCETIYNALLAYHASIEAARQAEIVKKNALQVQVSKYLQQGHNAFVKGHGYHTKGNDKKAVEYYLLFLHYYNMDPAGLSSYSKQREQVRKYVEGNISWTGYRRGDNITVDGVTFIVKY